ncbi:cytochrome P450 [Streptomyces flavofungini]|uniref:Cytochrome P450 n=1 Tax=Streptomyces flavofungini TaxID=68200 RepID=A0ABS0XDC4_9ACTN|nr:cytochrome P450 [Streptomyces flavofungini]MBJ3811226.1 cytochrome P450 [Streptomyces flavofungini]GHC66693.1 cytochrome P450 [Streptomyces flavofungini]
MTSVVERWNIHPGHQWLRGVRPDQTVRLDEETGVWHVYGYQEVFEVLTSPKTFSSKTAHLFSVQVDDVYSQGDMSQLDPPEQTRYRKLVSHGFTPRVIAELESRIGKITEDLLDEATGKGQIDLVADLAYPLPVIVISELLGIPASDREFFKNIAFAVIEGTTGAALISGGDDAQAQADAAVERVKALVDYMREQVLDRRRTPREDLISRLVAAEQDGTRLTDQEIINIANILLFTGHITTTMLLGNTLVCLDNDPEQFARVRADRSLVPGALEEGLRVLTPSAALTRRSATEVKLGGQVIPEEKVVMIWPGAANRDPAKFRDPDVYDVTRDPNPHLSFGHGVHFCIGAPLARAEGRIAMNILLDRYAELGTDPDNPPSFFPSPDMIGAKSLPLRVR